MLWTLVALAILVLYVCAGVWLARRERRLNSWRRLRERPESVALTAEWLVVSDPSEWHHVWDEDTH